MLENPSIGEQPQADYLERLHIALSRCPSLESYRGFLLELFDKEDQKLLSVLAGLDSPSAFLTAEDQLRTALGLTQKHNPSIIQQLKQLLPAESLADFDRYLETEDPCFMGALELYVKTQEAEEFVETFEIL